MDKNFDKLHLSYLDPEKAENMTPIQNVPPYETEEPKYPGNMSTNTI